MPKKSVVGNADLVEVKKATFEDVFEVLGISLRGSGEKRTGLCPIPSHRGEQTNETFCVHFGEQWFSCLQCRKKGNVLDFATAWFGGMQHAGWCKPRHNFRYIYAELSRPYSWINSSVSFET